MTNRDPHTPQETGMPTITRTITVRLDPEVGLCIACRQKYPVNLGHDDCPAPGFTDPAPADERRVNVTITDVYAAPDEPGFLRINVGPEGATIDQNASNVTVTDVEPAPADDLPGEPVEPGDLRAGDRVAYTYRWKRYEGALVVTTMRRQPITTLEHAGLLVTFEGRWAGGISDVRLIERAPADVNPDEALARVIFGDGFSSHEGLRLAQLDVARAAREHIEANERHKYDILMRELNEQNARAEKAEADLARVTKERDEYDAILSKSSDLLRRTANALKGEPEPLSSHSHHDLPEVAAEAMSMIEAHRVGIDTQTRRADKAEADLTRVTKERDGWRTKAQKIWNDTHSWLATIDPDNGGTMPVTRGRLGALISTIDRRWWSEPFFNPESPMRDTEQAES